MSTTATLSQTFTTQGQTGGLILTSIDLFFKSKDNSAPIQIEIRNTNNGSPGVKTNPNSIVIKQASQVNVSNIASIPTKFTFISPVILEEDVEYAIVVSTNSAKYKLWMATLGANSVNKPGAVNKQPNAGTLFITSGTGTNWEPNLMSDLMFTINKAKFTTNTEYSIGLKTTPLTTKFAAGNIMYTVAGSPIVYFRVANHGLFANDKVKLSVNNPVSPLTYNGIPYTDINGPASTGITTEQATKEYTVVWASMDAFAVSVSSSATTTGPCFVKCLSLTVNIKADMLHISLGEYVPYGSSISYSMKTISGKSRAGTQTSYIQSAPTPVILNKDIELAAPILVSNEQNRVSFASSKNNIELSAVFKTINENISPLVNSPDSHIILIDNRITDNTISPTLSSRLNTFHAIGYGTVLETTPLDGEESCKYVSKYYQVDTKATSLQVIFAGNAVAGNYIDVYYKTSATDTLAGQQWVQMSYPSNIFNNAATKSDFIDYSLDLRGMSEFKTFAIKLVMRGTESATPPRVKQLRVIALAI